ncbi:MAG: response regulator transcription factor [[Clostridium] spiroforme]|uniref:Response regulator transcription factor n=1 Tax=Thomasclavelia spiroformis TaxID=29348 RepID=A0A943I6F5_9FIRM|nr:MULTISPECIES: response regulator transcription factor [Thomasclavelia]MBS5588249.1 response regulator transcription factor [Thomasclavelia spiroformis]
MSELKKILVIEDDKTISDELKILLDDNGYDAYQLFNFHQITKKIIEFNPDLVLLDIVLPGTNGQTILKEIRKESNLPVIMLTSKTGDINEIMSMSYGADDYITKPYNPTLLLLRIETLFRHLDDRGSNNQIEYNQMTINLLKSTLTYKDNEIILSKNELTILYYLIKNHGKIVSRDELIDHLWDYSDFVDDNTLTVNINRLRKKMSNLGILDSIETRRKQGYILL